MSRIKLKFQGVQNLENISDVSMLLLSNEEENRSVAVMCDKTNMTQIMLRSGDARVLTEDGKSTDVVPEKLTRRMLPEVLCSILTYMTNLSLAVVITNVCDGQYQAVVEDTATGTTFPIRCSDGVLLTLADRFIPLYIEQDVWNFQSTPYCKNSPMLAIPINALTEDMLKASLDKAIENEQYEVAQHIKKEMEKRRRGNNQ